MSTEKMSPQSSIKEKNTKGPDTAVTQQLAKTKMCAFFERGKCATSNCRYAHSAAELRIVPNLQKTKLCRAFLAGRCTDDNCSFAHGEGDLRVTDGIYKTQVCNFFERGYCKKGDRCNHAHGMVDLRPKTPSTAATTPLSKVSPSSIGDASTRRRNPLPLSELLVSDTDMSGSLLLPAYSPTYSGIPPTPTRSVTELAQFAYSPAHTPLCSQYMGYPMSPTALWQPRDAVDMLVQDPRMMSPAAASPAANLLYAMDALEPRMDLLEQLPEHTPQRTFELLSLDTSTPYRPAPGLSEPPISPPAVPPSSPPGLESPAKTKAAAAEAGKESLMVNLSERLASLDALTMGLADDVASLKNDPNKRLHRI